MFDILSRDNVENVINGVKVIGFVDDVESMVSKEQAGIIPKEPSLCKSEMTQIQRMLSMT